MAKAIATMNRKIGGERPLKAHPLGEKMLTEEEISRVRNGVDGIRGSIPARCYYDEDCYRFEVDHILKKNWLCVGRWDQAKNKGDYFTRTMFGESLIIVRDRNGELHAHVNVCRHRWSRLVGEGSGNARLFVCPYHSWTYELDGSLRGIAVSPIPGLDKSRCRLHSIRLELWEGFIFVNFDPNAAALGPQLAGLSALVKDYGLASFEYAGDTTYEADWNYKFSFETGYEGYHSEGVHRNTLAGYGRLHRAYEFGDLWGTYIGEYSFDSKSFGSIPWLIPDKDYPTYVGGILYGAIYPNTVIVFTPYLLLSIITEHKSVDQNIATTFMAVAPWARERSPETEATQVEMMKVIQAEDTEGCRHLQAGVRSKFNTESFVHPLESQLSHYYQWMVDQYLKGAAPHP